MNFLKLLIENHRMPVIFRHPPRVRATVGARRTGCCRSCSPAPWSWTSRQSKILGERIGERTGSTVTLTTTVEPDIIGGIVVRVGNSILDASIRNRLEQLRTQVAQGAG